MYAIRSYYAFVRTLDSREALVEVAYPPSRRNDAAALLETLCTESSMQQVSTPPEALENLLCRITSYNVCYTKLLRCS